jgi:hypothetical protein
MLFDHLLEILLKISRKIPESLRGGEGGHREGEETKLTVSFLYLPR